MSRATPVIDRVAAKIHISTEHFYEGTPCWEFTSSLDPNGYGTIFYSGNEYRKVHRVMYELLVGPIPEGWVIDHLCRNTSCCRPRHLEPVTRGENVLRGTGNSAQNARKTHCSKGHPLSGPNLRISKDGKRKCRICRKAYRKNQYLTKGI